MNNCDAWKYLESKESARSAALAFVQDFDLDESQVVTLRYRFTCLKSNWGAARKSKNMLVWEDKVFYTIPSDPPGNRKKVIIETDISKEIRKPLSQLTLKGLRLRFIPLLNLIDVIAEKEEVDSKIIAAYALKLISNESRDTNTVNVCDQIISTGKFSNESKTMPLDKSTFLLDILEIGKRKYTNFRRVCKSENVNFPSYSKLAHYRNNTLLVNELTYVSNQMNETIGIAISYKRILYQSLSRLFETIPSLTGSQFPLHVKIADGLDGSGSHQIYNQYELNPTPSTKNFILFAFKILSFQDSDTNQVWVNSTPNSSFCVRPVVLLARKECLENVRFLMENIINPEVKVIENEGFHFPQGTVQTKIIRSMLDGKMSGILSGAGGAHCQLCTANLDEIKDLEMVRGGFPINRNISDAIDLFNFVDKEEFLALPSIERLGITHEPVSDKNIMSASPLHSYTCIFRWFMLLVYHLQLEKCSWNPTSKQIETCKKFCSDFLFKKTGLRIDQPASDGGTSSTGNVPRQCF